MGETSKNYMARPRNQLHWRQSNVTVLHPTKCVHFVFTHDATFCTFASSGAYQFPPSACAVQFVLKKYYIGFKFDDSKGQGRTLMFLFCSKTFVSRAGIRCWNWPWREQHVIAVCEQCSILQFGCLEHGRVWYGRCRVCLSTWWRSYCQICLLPVCSLS